MALKKGFCTHCKGEERLRIFDVNREAEVCYCPNCMAEMKPKEAIANYRGLISHYLKKASKELFESTQYLEAYQTFAHVIDLDETIRVARFGRVLALVYVSTLRKSKIPFALALHRQEATKAFHYQDTAKEYFYFLMLLLDALDTYESRLKKRITIHHVFYDMDCVLTYLKRVDEIRQYKDFVVTEAEFFIDSNKEYFAEVITRVNKSQEHYVKIYQDSYVTADGYTYIFNRFDNNGMPLVSIKSGRPNVELRSKKIELNPTDNKKSAIKDEIYLNNLPLSRLVAASVPMALFLIACALAAVVAFILVEPIVLKVLLLFGAVGLVVVSLILIILHFSWKNSLKKKYYNGTNPFILK